jgi:hypothetical protein
MPEQIFYKTACFYLIFLSLRKNDLIAISVAFCNFELSKIKNILLKPTELINFNQRLKEKLKFKGRVSFCNN